MNHSPARRSSRPSVAPPPADTCVVQLCIAFSGLYPYALQDIDRRLSLLLSSCGIAYRIAERRITLLRIQRSITPTEWSALIGWLLCQPEVVFVAREYPLTRRPHGPAR